MISLSNNKNVIWIHTLIWSYALFMSKKKKKKLIANRECKDAILPFLDLPVIVNALYTNTRYDKIHSNDILTN